MFQVARGVLFTPDMKPTNDQNQGEGDKVSARHYNRQVREFVAEGKVDEAAKDAADYVERDPGDAQRAERAAKKGPNHPSLSVDELIAKGKTVVDRVRPIVDRVVDTVRSKINRK